MLWERLPHEAAQEPPRIGVKSMTAHADVVGLELFHEMIPTDLDNRTRTRVRSWSDDGRLTGITLAGGSIIVYDKWAEIRARPDAANLALRRTYAALGYRESMGTIWRVEARYGADRLRRYGLQDLESVFRHALSRLRVLEPGGERGVRKADRTTQRAWALLADLRFRPPWEGACCALPPLPPPPEHWFRRLLGQFVRALARLAVFLGIAASRVVEALRRAVPQSLARWPEAEDRFREAMREIQARGGE